MKNLKKYVGVLMLLALPALHAQIADDTTIEWCTVSATINENIGMVVNQIYHHQPDIIAAVLDVRWWIEDGDLFLDYGNGYPLLILADVYVEGRYLTGRLYSNNIDQGTVTIIQE